ncbi:hypothetical protein TREES_T100010108 [Tupaia chinensis]|uniref:Uncharacterized protein n=1 Tax=Tupaia chinensis TaxID=246437 RepID=L9JBQ6_TUPCH|nr:hypothetical protein TREES_T100010108 [Tupaia chinensis]
MEEASTLHRMLQHPPELLQEPVGAQVPSAARGRALRGAVTGAPVRGAPEDSAAGSGLRDEEKEEGEESAFGEHLPCARYLPRELQTQYRLVLTSGPCRAPAGPSSDAIGTSGRYRHRCSSLNSIAPLLLMLRASPSQGAPCVLDTVHAWHWPLRAVSTLAWLGLSFPLCTMGTLSLGLCSLTAGAAHAPVSASSTRACSAHLAQVTQPGPTGTTQGDPTRVLTTHRRKEGNYSSP